MTVAETSTAPVKPVVVVTAGGRNPQILVNALAARFPRVVVVREQPESKQAFLKRRARKLGVLAATGQFLTMVVSRFGKRFTERRAQEILRIYGVSDAENLKIPVLDVASVNSAAAIERIRSLDPGVIFLVSCRMLSAQTLGALPCPVVNFHAGINPRYRGLMGGYWARVENDLENFGATVHLVDAGVDTGGILYQARMAPSKSDTLHTYPLLQTAAATDIAVKAVEDALAGKLRVVPVAGPSRQWYHPPVWTWLWHGLARGIW